MGPLRYRSKVRRYQPQAVAKSEHDVEIGHEPPPPSVAIADDAIE
jgi:hypothetical protein